MPWFRVSGDLRVAFIIDVEANSSEEAEKQVSEMKYNQIRNDGDIDTPTASVEIDGAEEINIDTGEAV